MHDDLKSLALEAALETDFYGEVDVLLESAQIIYEWLID
jgi:hypothetical protein